MGALAFKMKGVEENVKRKYTSAFQVDWVLYKTTRRISKAKRVLVEISKMKPFLERGV